MYTTKMMLKLALAAAMTLQTAIAGPIEARNGCYGNGPTFGDLGFNNPGFINDACNTFQGGFADGALKSHCINNGPNSVFLSVQRFGGSGNGDLLYDDCVAAFVREYNACTHGSEQDYSQFHYRIDPNNGNC